MSQGGHTEAMEEIRSLQVRLQERALFGSQALALTVCFDDLTELFFGTYVSVFGRMD